MNFLCEILTKFLDVTHCSENSIPGLKDVRLGEKFQRFSERSAIVGTEMC